MTNSSIGSTTVNTLSTTTTDSYTSSTTAQTGVVFHLQFNNILFFFCYTHTVSMDPLCAANATWESQGVTVAGSSNGASSSLPTGLNKPIDILIDISGNLFIADCNNYRVVYWPVNATAGHIVAGTGAYSSWINSFKCAAGIVGKKEIEFISI